MALSRHLRPVALAVCLAAANASAQAALSPVDLERLQLNLGGAGALTARPGTLLPAGAVRVWLAGHYQFQPLSVAVEGAGNAGALVKDRWQGHFAAAWAPIRWLELGLHVPYLLSQTGDDLTAAGLVSPATRGLGTLGVQATVGLLAQRAGTPLDLALTLAAGLPTGSAAALARERSATFTPHLSVGHDLGDVRLGAELGAMVRPTTLLVPGADALGNELGSEAFGAAVVAMSRGPVRAELTARGAIPFSRTTFSGELLAGARAFLGAGLEAFAVAGPGLGARPGTPIFRAVGGLAFQPTASGGRGASTEGCAEGGPHLPGDCPDLDDDGDGLRNADDQCPEQPQGNEVGAANGCPPPDADGDGVRDTEDDCPSEAGVAERKGCPLPSDTDRDGVADPDDRCPELEGVPAFKGCPEGDSDGDGIEDVVDQCPDKPGDLANFGCPDTDGDGVAEDQDRCPNEAGPASNQGCPKSSPARPSKPSRRGGGFRGL